MQISDFAQLTGVSVHALRHYERLGLIQPTRRSSGYRDYTEAMRRELIFISMSRMVGISLKQIAEQLPAYRAGRLGIETMVLALQARVSEIDQQTENLLSQRSKVISHIAWLEEKQLLKQQTRRDAKAPWPTAKAPARLKPPTPKQRNAK